MLRLQEFLNDPAVKWSVGKYWPPDKFRPTEDFFRDVLSRLTAQKYETDKQIERKTDNVANPESLAGVALDSEYEAVESRIELDDLRASLPPSSERLSKSS